MWIDSIGELSLEEERTWPEGLPGKRFGGGHGPWPLSPWEPSACPGQPTDGEDVEEALGTGLDGKDRGAKEGTPARER